MNKYKEMMQKTGKAIINKKIKIKIELFIKYSIKMNYFNLQIILKNNKFYFLEKYIKYIIANFKD